MYTKNYAKGYIRKIYMRKKDNIFEMITEHKRILKELEIMYHEDAKDIFDKLLPRLNTFKTTYQPTSSVFTEEDVILICYGDHVFEKGNKTLKTMKKFIDSYVKEVINTVHFLPFFPYSSDDGFSIIDYKKINPPFGSWKEINEIRQNVKLMFDFVVNHISKESKWFKEFLKGTSPYTNFFITPPKNADTSKVFRPRTHPLLTPFKTKNGTKLLWTTFSDDQIDLNFKSTILLQEIIKIFLFYINQGARFIRLDAIAFLWKEIGTTCLHLPETHAFVRLLRAILDYCAPDVKIITETNVPHKDNISYFGDGTNEAHLIYNFTLPPLLLYTFMKENVSKLRSWATTLHIPDPTKTAFFNFTASHDGIGLTPLEGLVSEKELNELAQDVLSKNGKVNYRTIPGKQPQPYELTIVYLDAIGSKEAFVASQVIAISFQGIPGIYFNSLIGAENDLKGLQTKKYNRAINREKFEFNKLTQELTTRGTTKEFVYYHFKNILSKRKKEPAFSPEAKQEIIDVGDSCFGIVRKNTTTNDTIVALINISAKRIKLPSKRISEYLNSKKVTDIISSKTINLTTNIQLPPFGYVWLK